ncbi:hypothetical protein A0U94_14915 (plasmid) [Gluconobacter albidus]|uniref:hypothetical protein n=1 Tax=Gluconobacter albidus TaxID=318683 RepID=UPI00098B72DF|nr:hypothetical protein [Gluconobacter albidus]AQS92456.1 hypothetical protein A0U94_14915 [Gluconobacter albidus]
MVADRDIENRINEARKLGRVSSSEWQSYTWKNELAEQRRRIIMHLGEAFAEVETDNNSYHMLEKAVGLAAICMRRLIECRLVTDHFCATPLEVHEIMRKKDAKWREPFVSRTASEIFNNYDMTGRQLGRKMPKTISDKMLHARVIGVLCGSTYLPDGLLIASDTQSKKQLFHFSPREITSIFDAFLEDEVRQTYDGYLDQDGQFSGTGKVFATRK